MKLVLFLSYSCNQHAALSSCTNMHASTIKNMLLFTSRVGLAVVVVQEFVVCCCDGYKYVFKKKTISLLVSLLSYIKLEAKAECYIATSKKESTNTQPL